MNAVRFSVVGLVQGVGFRWFVVSQARRLDIRGYARNMADGTVEVVALGTGAALHAFEARLREGPPAAVVDRVEREEIEVEGDRYNRFDIK